MYKFLEKNRTEARIFAFAFLAGLIFLALFFAAYQNRFWESDPAEYRMLGKNLLENGTYSLDSAPPYRPSISYPPLYPLFMIFASAGTFHPFWILLTQNILAALSAIILYKISFEFFRNRKLSLIASALFILEPGMLFFTNQLYPEALFTFLLLAGILGIVKYLDNWNFRHLALSAVSLALMTLTRPNGEYLSYIVFVFLAIYVLVKNITEFYKKILPLAGFAALFVLTLSPWLIRSQILYGAPVVSSTGNYSVVSRTIGSYIAWKKNIPMREASKESKQLFIQRGIRKEAIEEYDFYIDTKIPKEAAKIVFSDPVGFAQSQMRFLIPYFFGTGWSEIVKIFKGDDSKPPYFISNIGPSIFEQIKTASGKSGLAASFGGAALFGVIYILAIAGLWKGFSERKTFFFALLFVFVIAYFAVSTGELSYSRYRYPVNPLIFILAAEGGFILWNVFRSRRAHAPEQAS